MISRPKTGARQECRTRVPRKHSPTQELAYRFVTEVLARAWTPADYRGRHMKAASNILKMGYDYDSVVAALLALRDKDYVAFGLESERDLPREVSGMEVLYAWGEPPLIERFLTPPARPPVYSWDYDVWVQRWGAVAIRRGDWDGVYRRCDPESVGWLQGVIGDRCYEESVREWTLQKTNQRSKLSSDT